MHIYKFNLHKKSTLHRLNLIHPNNKIYCYDTILQVGYDVFKNSLFFSNRWSAIKKTCHKCHKDCISLQKLFEFHFSAKL